MKRKLWLFLSLSAMTHIALATPIINADAKSIPFTFSQPAQMEITDLPGCGVLRVYVYDKSFGAASDPVTMTCGDGSEGSIRVFPGEVRYCAYIHNKVSVALLPKDFINGTTGTVDRYSFGDHSDPC